MLTDEIIKSWKNRTGNVNSIEDILTWIESRKESVHVDVRKIDFSYNGFWHYDEKDGYIRNENNSFFQIAGYQEIEDDQIIAEQPIIIQDEIGYLGVICKVIDGTLNFLMQAKIEPGNINVIQLSPTVQATKSNFTRKHGGKTPKYLEYFTDISDHKIIVDQVQSEQSSRFYKKRNRNMIVYVEDDIPVYDTHRWMTLGQIKELMKIDNLVNMDTRTVLSCIPLIREEVQKKPIDEFYDGLMTPVDIDQIHHVFSSMNEYKMYRNENSRLLPIRSLKGWEMKRDEISCRSSYDFKVIYCRIEVADREVRYWEQPLFESVGEGIIGLLSCVKDGVRKYLVRMRPEMGCFDSVELGPTVQLYPSNLRGELDVIESMFLNHINTGKCVYKDVKLSEEGGRFFHEQNRNILVEIDCDGLVDMPKDYFWMDYSSIAYLIQYNNCVNIQLRNLMALIDE